jgi:hypothetical protein
MIGLPPKWTHLNFIEELIFDFFRWNKGSDKPSSSSASVASLVVASTTRQGSAYASASTAQSGTFYDIETKEGRVDWFTCNKPNTITPPRMKDNWFSVRHDGTFDPFIPCTSYIMLTINSANINTTTGYLPVSRPVVST